MNIKPQTMIAILLAGGAVSASTDELLASKTELEAYDNARGWDIPLRLYQHGILMPTSDGSVYLLNPAKMHRLSTVESLQLLKDLTSWLSNQEYELQWRDWRGMEPSAQDYHGAE